MTKRANDLQLPVTSALSEASYDDARQLIIDEVMKEKLHGGYEWYVLTVASQNLGVAIVMRMHLKFTIDIDCSYTPIEWSLTRKTVIDKDISSTTVWSEGV